MKQITIFLLLVLFSMSACNKDKENLYNTETGTVLDYTGTGKCGIVIALDNGKIIQPLYFPEGFTFSAGQRVLVDYVELKKVLNSCETGVPCEISYLEELSCQPWVELSLEDYDSLGRDPVHVHDASIDGNCLYIKLSYGGGCQIHSIDLALINGNEAEGGEMPVFEIHHNANDDLCEAWITREFRFDISPLRTAGVGQFQVVAPLYNDETYFKTFDLNTF